MLSAATVLQSLQGSGCLHITMMTRTNGCCLLLCPDLGDHPESGIISRWYPRSLLTICSVWGETRAGAALNCLVIFVYGQGFYIFCQNVFLLPQFYSLSDIVFTIFKKLRSAFMDEAIIIKILHNIVPIRTQIANIFAEAPVVWAVWGGRREGKIPWTKQIGW